jgi:hypothetical protein
VRKKEFGNLHLIFFLKVEIYDRRIRNPTNQKKIRLTLIPGTSYTLIAIFKSVVCCVSNKVGGGTAETRPHTFQRRYIYGCTPLLEYANFLNIHDNLK